MRVAVLIACAALAAGCGAAGNKAGGPTPPLTVLLQSPDGESDATDAFVRVAQQRSHGTLRIVIDEDPFTTSDPANERRLVRALAAGRQHLALLPSRAWEFAGVKTFRPLQAPFFITDYTVLRRVATGPVAAQILAGTNAIGVTGLALLPDELRRPLGRKPFTTPASFRGARIRGPDSRMTAAIMHALGARLTTGYLSTQVGDALLNGDLDGVESSPGWILKNTYHTVAPYLTANVIFFPKTNTIAANAAWLSHLDPTRRDAIRAGALAARKATLTIGATDDADIQTLCAQGARLVTASRADLATLRREVQPVYRQLAADPTTARIMRAIAHLGGDVPVSAQPVPARCRTGPQQVRVGKTAIPNGVYVTHLTAADMPLQINKPEHVGTYTTTMRDGHFRGVQVPAPPGQPPLSGVYTVDRDVLTFVFAAPADMKGLRESVRWSYYRGNLTLHTISVADSVARVQYNAHPWRRVSQ